MKVDCFQISDTTPVSPAKITELVRVVRSRENSNLKGEIRVILADDDYMLNLNREFLNHNYPTDVLSFALESNGNTLDAEVYINVELACQQARDYHTTPRDEVLRLAVHGALHLLGYDDRTESGRRTMRAKEDSYLHNFGLNGKEL